jgi:TetR/AcrR family transcriptional repressor of nem operon
MAALVGEITRQGAAVRHHFTDAVRTVTKRITSLMPGRRRSEDDALAIIATMVGALTLARAVDDPELSDRILTAARTRLTARQSRAVSTLVS